MIYGKPTNKISKKFKTQEVQGLNNLLLESNFAVFQFVTYPKTEKI